MQRLLGPLARLSFSESALLVLVAVIGALTLLAIVFGLYTVVLRIRNERSARRWKRLEAVWQEPLLRALDDPQRTAEVHAVVDRRHRLHFVRFVLDYARRVRGDERELLRSLAEPYLEPITRRARSKDREIRVRAVQTLGALGLPRYADDVVAALDDPSPLVAMIAARALATQQQSLYASAILRRIHRFGTWSRGFLASMLATIGPDGAPALRETLADRKEPPWVRATAADALRDLADLEAADLAVDVVESEEDPELVMCALRLLSVVGRPEHAPVARSRSSSSNPLIRSAALRALGTLGEERDTRRLLGAMGDQSPWVAIQAAHGLYEAGAQQLLWDLADSDHPRAPLARQILVEEGEA